MSQHRAECDVGNVFQVSHISQLISRAFRQTKYEKQGKCLSVLHDATCDNYFIVKFLLKSNVSRVILLTYWLQQACLI